MPLATILKKASSYVLGSENESDGEPRIDDQVEDNEALFCKNNVCVHPPTMARHELDILHYPGYMTVTSKTFIDQHTNAKRHTLLLTWIPNSTLRKCPAAVVNGLAGATGVPSSPKAVAAAAAPPTTENCTIPIEFKFNSKNPFLDMIHNNNNNNNMNGNTSDYSGSMSMSSSSDRIERDSAVEDSEELATHPEKIQEEEDDLTEKHQEEEMEGGDGGVGGGGQNDKVKKIHDHEEEAEDKDLINELQPLLESEDKLVESFSHVLKAKSGKQMTSVNITIADPRIENQDLSPSESCLLVSGGGGSAASSAVAGSGSVASSLNLLEEQSANSAAWMSPELLAYKHNLSFPESSSSSPVLHRKFPTATAMATLKCRRFSVDLSQMRSLRLFFSDTDCTSGQLVIASRESQYKIMHFHHGGLDHLAQVLHQWHCLLHNIHLAPNGGHQGPGEQGVPYRHFMVCRPEVRKSELHPEEGHVVKITTDYFYGTLLNKKGQIEDDLLLRKCVFFGGLEKKLRKTVWPFLLHCYSFYSTFEDRAALLEIRRQEYDELTKRRLYSMSPEQQAQFWKTVQCVIEKDVVRTDRSNPYFAGDDNPNVELMKNILLNYAFYNPKLSYTQGMSDLLAPVLCEIKNESETFWCFVGLMQRAVFVCQPLDNDIDRNLKLLRELIRIMLPKFYGHLMKYTDSMELLFCHRWILLCFKREFTEAVAIRMWEACWSNYLTDYFHLFLCLGIMAVYADDVIAQNLSADEMLLYFSSLAMYMDGQLILRKARGMLHEFRQLTKIPCTLSTLCKRCGPGMWDSGHHPAIECVGHLDNESCAFAFE